MVECALRRTGAVPSPASARYSSRPCGGSNAIRSSGLSSEELAEHEIPLKHEIRKYVCSLGPTIQGRMLLNCLRYKMLPASVSPAVGGVQHGQNCASLRTLPNLARAGQQLGFAAPQPVHRDQHELAVERVDDLRAFERDGVVRDQHVEAQCRGTRRRLDA